MMNQMNTYEPTFCHCYPKTATFEDLREEFEAGNLKFYHKEEDGEQWAVAEDVKTLRPVAFAHDDWTGWHDVTSLEELMENWEHFQF